jgi:uncharacterized phage-associated protein
MIAHDFHTSQVASHCILRNDTSVHFPNNHRKATDAIARLIEKSGADVDYLRIAKLIYLADRRSILERGVPIFGGKYYSMRRGPTISEFMDFANQRNAPGWSKVISPRKGNALNLISKPHYQTLSDYEKTLLDAVVAEHFNRSTIDLVEWCHQNCPEYEEVESGRRPIEVETILKSGGKKKAQVEKVLAMARELDEMDALLA